MAYIESVAVIMPQHAKTALSMPMSQHVAIAMKNVGVGSIVVGFQVEFTTALKDCEHSIFAQWPTSGASRSLEAIFVGFAAISQRLGMCKIQDFVERPLLQLVRGTGAKEPSAGLPTMRLIMGQPMRVVLIPTMEFRQADTMPHSAEICSTIMATQMSSTWLAPSKLTRCETRRSRRSSSALGSSPCSHRDCISVATSRGCRVGEATFECWRRAVEGLKRQAQTA